jgi:aminopeptidase N
MWLLFNRFKSKAIEHDQYNTTRKIRDQVLDTKHAETIFDEMTYYKGASVLKYYYYVIGSELFFKSLRNYISKYRDGNANYENFVEILQNLCDSRGIKAPINIVQPFLNNKGVNRIRLDVKNTLTHITEVKVKQEPCNNASKDIYYDIITDILLIYEDGKQELIKEVHIKNESISEIIELIGKELPVAIILNPGDWSYFKQTFTTETVNWLINYSYVYLLFYIENN